MNKSLSIALLALAIGTVPLAAQASSNVTIGIGISSGPVYARPYYPPPAPRALPQRDIEILLINKGYRIEHIDRRGNAYFVRAVYGYDVYDGLINCYTGAWLQRDRVGFYRTGNYWSLAGGYWNGWSSRYGWGPPAPPRPYYPQRAYWGWDHDRDWNRDHDHDGHGNHDHDDHDGHWDGHGDNDHDDGHGDHGWDNDRDHDDHGWGH